MSNETNPQPLTFEQVMNSPETHAWAERQAAFFAPNGGRDQLASALVAGYNALPRFTKGEEVTVKVKGHIHGGVVKSQSGQIVDVRVGKETWPVFYTQIRRVGS